MTEFEIQKKLLNQSMWIECTKCKGKGKIIQEHIFYDNNNVEAFQLLQLVNVKTVTEPVKSVNLNQKETF